MYACRQGLPAHSTVTRLRLTRAPGPSASHVACVCKWPWGLHPKAEIKKTTEHRKRENTKTSPIQKSQAHLCKSKERMVSVTPTPAAEGDARGSATGSCGNSTPSITCSREKNLVMCTWHGHTYKRQQDTRISLLPPSVLSSIYITSVCYIYIVARLEVFGFFCKRARIKIACLTNHFPLLTIPTSH